MIEVSHLSKSYGSRPAVQDLSFTVPDGQIYGLLGPNGAGKSTIMNILTGYLAPTEGEVKVAGFRLPEQAQRAKACVGYLPEQPPLYPEMTVQEYLDFVAELKGVKHAQRKQQVLAAARRTGLEEVLPRVIRSLSKGYRQRVGIAQALLGSPQLIILDEPTVGLDPAQVIEIRNLIRELGKAHTVILSSHILSEVQAVCDQVLIIAHGRLVAMGTPNELAGRLEGHQTLTATAQGEAACVLAAAAGVEGLTDVTLTGEKDGEVSFTANAPAGSDLRGALSAALAAAGCPVLALGTAAVSLEDVFLQLVEESAPEADAKQAAPEPPAEAPEDSARPEPEDRSSEEENAE
ncbi:MAG: ABC transporter ATP-binding protein [Bacteroidales bacterium]|nr:ABC transporter ATP-binding protein [Bacteroidales bacterium]